MVYLEALNLSKRYGERVLFENVDITIAKGERVALIAKNGTGKTSLLNILTKNDEPDSGTVVIDKNINVAYLPQEPVFNAQHNVWEAVFNNKNKQTIAIANYELLLEELEVKPNDAELQKKLQQAIDEIEALGAWDLEARTKTVLTHLNLQYHLHQNVNSLSGGQKKRLALASILIQQPDLMLLDEPTNHLDISMIEWLEGYLKSQDITLLLVTHDRYFLDNICTEIIELDNGKLYTYKGNYAYYLEKKAMRESYEAAELDKAKKLARKELEWMCRQPKARTTKSKSRINAYYDIKEKASLKKDDGTIEINMPMQRLGTKILDVQHICKSYDGRLIIDDFTYLFKRGERVGIVGKNGAGKTTLLNIIQQIEKSDSGSITAGETIKFGYYSQKGLQLNEDKRVIDVITDIAEYIEFESGKKLTASALLKLFLFDAKKQHTFVSLLSGAEKRRLYLLTILMQKPNFLILDEPTNDLDIDTLNILEDFLENFQGCLLIVTHDRYFMDNLVDSLLVFEGNGKIKSFNGNYQEYLNELQNEKALKTTEKTIEKTIEKPIDVKKKKAGYKEQREFEILGKEIEALQNQRNALEKLLSSGSSNHTELMQWSEEIKHINNLLDEKELRWLELSEICL
ncbi:MAG: ABC-F family ATP-binding cassette domain-containing protein [Bacteroidia bacterium]